MKYLILSKSGDNKKSMFNERNMIFDLQILILLFSALVNLTI
jgi:hypothetical protein